MDCDTGRNSLPDRRLEWRGTNRRYLGFGGDWTTGLYPPSKEALNAVEGLQMAYRSIYTYPPEQRERIRARWREAQRRNRPRRKERHKQLVEHFRQLLEQGK